MPFVKLRNSRRLTTALLCAAAALASFCSPKPAPAGPARNVVIICIDTLRADHVSAYGYGRATTPFIDSLSRKGALFPLAYAHSNWTIPSTASLLTSRLPTEHGAGIDGEMRLLGEDSKILQIDDDVETLATMLKRHGFRTGLFSANPFLFGKFERDFDRAEVDRRPAGELTALAQKWLDEQPAGKPFFLYLQYIDLHHPIEPPPPFFNLFPVAEGGKRTQDHTGWTWGEVANEHDLARPEFRQWRAHHIALYDGALRYVDSMIEQLYRHLEASGRAKDTIFVITSDHGEEFWDHTIEQSGDTSNPRRFWGVGHGHTMYEELIRVPLIVHGPVIREPRTVKCMARLIDVVPTVLEAIGAERPRSLRGRSLIPYIASKKQAQICAASPLIAESPAYGPDTTAIVFNGRKLVKRIDGVELFFDLREDPFERTNLAASQPKVVAALRAVMARERVTIDPAAPREAVKMDEETRQQLRSLGYLH